MKALIFAAGKGLRMMPLTAEKPKPMLEVLGKPLLAHIMGILPREISEIIIVVGYKGEMIKDFFGDNFDGRKIIYVQQEEQLGTGNALMLCENLIPKGERFLIVYADDLRDSETIARAIEKGERAIFVSHVPNPTRFGVVVTEQNGRIIDLEENPKEPKTDMAVAAAYLVDTDIFKYPPTREANGEYYINSMLLQYMREHDVFAEVVDFWLPIGYPEDLKKAEEVLSKRPNA